MAVKHLIIFVLLMAEGAYAINALINTEADGNIGLCTKNAQLIWHFTWKYFKDRHAVSVLANKDKSLYLTFEIMRCAMEISQLSLQCTTSSWNPDAIKQRRKLEKDNIFYQHETNGLVFVTESAENIKMVLHTIDPQAKAVIILTNTTIRDVSDILTSAWGQYHILNLVIFHTTKKVNSSLLHISAYDPFIIRNDIRGFVYTLESSAKRKNAIWNKLSRIIKMRLTEVHYYPLQTLSYEGCFIVPVEWYDPSCLIINTIIMTKKFEPIVLERYLEQNETSIEQLDNGHFDIMAYIELPMSRHGQKHSEFLFPIARKGYGFLTPKMQPNPTMTFIKIFSLEVSIALAFSYIALVVSWSWFQKKHYALVKNGVKRIGFVQICYLTLGNFLLISQPGIGPQCYERCLLISWLLFSMVICFSYQATMVEHLTAGDISRDINTLEELADSDLKILIKERYMSLMAEGAADEGPPYIYKRLLERSENDTWLAFDQVKNDRDAALLCDLSECMVYTHFSADPSEENGVHVFERGPPGTYDSYMVPIDSPYKDVFNKILMTLLESGLSGKWRQDLTHFRRLMILHDDIDEVPRRDTYKMKDLSLIFWSWLGCCCFCSMVFIGELLWPYISHKRGRRNGENKI